MIEFSNLISNFFYSRNSINKIFKKIFYKINYNYLFYKINYMKS